MLIDLHTHTYPASLCSSMSASALLQEADRRHLPALCVTDHLTIRGGQQAQALARAASYRVLVLRGVEARSTMGDVLVYGVDEDFPEGIDGPDLLRHVHERGGASVLAHPFRRGGGWALWYWLEKHGLALGPELAARPEFMHLHAVETANAQTLPAETAQAEELARLLNLPGTGGSDAHRPSAIGTAYSECLDSIASELDLVAAIRAGRIRPARP